MTSTSVNSNTSDATETLAQDLVEHVRAYGPVAVAFSGGVDSAVVARAAVEALGDKAVAVTAVSHSLATSELNIARGEATLIGIRHVEVNTTEFERPEYRANAGNRCFFCKDTLYRITAAKLSELDVSRIINGANTDDLGDHRPGMTAAKEHHVRSPLVELGINKSQVRQLARFWNLSVAEKPASPCLSSRIAYGVEVTEERVRRVELAEAFIRELTGLNELRVRCEADELARIEVPLESLSQLAAEASRRAVATRLKELGFRRVTLDLDGFRSGSLNDVLPVVRLGGSREKP
ncbi:MAG TPA: ATP-dependent sacrificial sulfur transferase LarE [Planctomycetes bacterium]|nr:ATP-dependent sacrificial sulfur transferase LarE [Fuerstiella sp.]HIK90633.1 ATP-dependent sacrificial sulfur transferase LarE [Planctomycetota bacterium]